MALKLKLKIKSKKEFMNNMRRNKNKTIKISHH